MAFYEVPEDEILLAEWADRVWTLLHELKLTRKVSDK
jgi:FPC/CPF motif-containing protein YcgG